MLQLLSPAGSPEAVIAAVQSGADIVHIGRGLTAAEDADGFTADQLIKSLRYCRVRGCQCVYSLPSPLSDTGLEEACRQAVFAAENGADAISVQDIGLVRVLRRLLPDTPLWGDMRLGISDLGAVKAAAALGLSRVMLAPGLRLSEIADICKASPIETIVCVHGHLCFARPGQCYLAAFSEKDAPRKQGWCAEPCRDRYDLGGRMDDRPMNMKDLCLLDHIPALAEAGVTCVSIEGHGRSAEYVASATGLYFRAVRNHIVPTAQERQELEELFSPGGITDAPLQGESDNEMFVTAAAAAAAKRRRAMDAIRRRYMKGELRRVPLTFHAVIQPGKPALFAAEDDRGNQAVTQSFEPVDLDRPGIGEARVKEILYRTGGTPFSCGEVRCSVDARMDFPDEAVDEARKELIRQIVVQRRVPKALCKGDMPPMPKAVSVPSRPKLICQISRAEQLSEALADSFPDMLYAPAELIAADCEGLQAFRDRNIPIVAVLPQNADQHLCAEHLALLRKLRDRGIAQVLGGSFAWLGMARALGLEMRGDYGFNAANAYTLATLAEAGLLSATVSFELSMAQIEAMPKALNTEMIAYGRMPVMTSDHCILQRSAGRCNCGMPVMMHDREGRQYPVLKNSGCGNTVYDASKIFLADRLERCQSAGLWGLRLLFSAENAKECVDVLRRYQSRGSHIPTNASRGLYGKGAL